VVKFDIQNHNNSTSPVPVDFSDDKGYFVYHIGGSSQPALEKIRAAIGKHTDNVTRVVIVRKMRSVYILAADARAGDTRIAIKGSSVLTGKATIAPGTNKEEKVRFIPLPTSPSPPPPPSGSAWIGVERMVQNSQNPNTPSFIAGLKNSHSANTEIEYRAGGWSTDPIIVAEEYINHLGVITSKDLNVIKTSIMHEVGHVGLNLTDIIDTVDDNTYRGMSENMMDGEGNADSRLHYCPRPLRRDKDRSGTPATEENQWEKIERPEPEP